MNCVQIRVYDSLPAIESLAPEWNRLLDRFPTATIFSTPEWLGAWWRAFGGARRLAVVGFFDAGEGLVGLAPLAFDPVGPIKVLRLMGDGSGDSDNLDIPVCPGRERQVAEELVSYLGGADGWDVCQLNTLPSHSPVARCLIDHLQERGWTHFHSSRPWCAIGLPASWEEYLRQLSSKERGKIGLRTRALEKRYPVRYRKCGPDDRLASLAALYHLHQIRWQRVGEPGSFASPERRQFYEEISRVFLERNWLEFWRLEMNGETVAAQFGFRYRDTVFSLQEGFDPAYAPASVGYVLRAHVLKQLIEQGVRRYDFLAGDSDSKRRWGAEVGEYWDLHFARPWSRGALYLRSRASMAGGKEWLRRRLPGAWRLLHRLRLRWRGQRGNRSAAGAE